MSWIVERIDPPLAWRGFLLYSTIMIESKAKPGHGAGVKSWRRNRELVGLYLVFNEWHIVPISTDRPVTALEFVHADAATAVAIMNLLYD